MSVLTTRPKFLYPHSRQFPFDEVAEKIVRAIEKRNWKVPGLTIEFDTYGSGEAKYQVARCITGNDFKLYFCRVQGKLAGNWNDTAALRSVCIPKQSMEVYEDESGPIYYLYVGKNWEADKEWFMNSFKALAKLNNKPRRYLKYEKPSCYQNQRAGELVSDNDLEYSPEGDEPVCINFEQKFNEFTDWLKEFVLDYILSFPEAKEIQSPTPMEELIPYKGLWDTVFSICSPRDAERIKKGKKSPKELPPEKRHAYFGSGHRLVPLSVQRKDRFPDVAYEGFIWCDVNQEQKITRNSKFAWNLGIAPEVMSAMSSTFTWNYLVAINLKYANQVYVVDNSKYEESRQQLFKAIAPRKRLTDEELGDAFAARGATIVPITEYKGGYKEPIILINRELDFDEIGWLVKIKEYC